MGAKAVNDDNEIMIITNEGIIIRLLVSGISKLGRITSGVKLMDIDTEKDIRVASVAKVRESSTATNEEDILKKLEQELAEENIPVEGAEEDSENPEASAQTETEPVTETKMRVSEETEETNATNKEDFAQENPLKEEDLSDINKLVERALKDQEEEESK